MAKYAETRWCDGCGVEITWAPVLLGNRICCGVTALPASSGKTIAGLRNRLYRSAITAEKSQRPELNLC
jgi:hypothetical protein